MLLPLLLLLAPPEDCAIGDREALLALDQDRFDQDMSGGWRALSSRRCYVEAADLIRDYRKRHGLNATEGMDQKRFRSGILFWHEGQMRAFAGQAEAAIALFEQSRHPPGQRQFGWNLYVDGSIAFLRGDRPSLEAARTALSKLPPPPDWTPPRGPDGQPIPIAWPPNLHVLDNLLRCFGQSYAAAYGRCAA